MGIRIEDNGYDGISLKRKVYPAIQNDVKKTDEIFEKYNIPKSVVELTPYGVTNRSIAYNLNECKKFTLLYNSKVDNTVYKSISKSQAQNLYGSYLDKKSVKTVEKFEKQINMAYNNKGLYILIISEEDSKKINAVYKKLIDEMVDKKFEFITFDDLSKDSYLEEKDKTLKNYIKTSPLSVYLR